MLSECICRQITALLFSYIPSFCFSCLAPFVEQHLLYAMIVCGISSSKATVENQYIANLVCFAAETRRHMKQGILFFMFEFNNWEVTRPPRLFCYGALSLVTGQWFAYSYRLYRPLWHGIHMTSLDRLDIQLLMDVIKLKILLLFLLYFEREWETD